MRAIIVEQHTLYQNALVSLIREIRPELAPVGTDRWDSPLLQEISTGLIVISTTTASRDLINALSGLLGADRTIPILVLVEYADIGTATAAFSAGIKGMVLKSAHAGILAGAIDLLLNGDICFPSNLTPSERNRRPQQPVSGLNNISPRQRDVLDLLASGCSNQEIANRLHIRESTVKNHIQAIFRTFHVTSRTQAVIAAANAGLVLKPPPVPGTGKPVGPAPR